MISARNYQKERKKSNTADNLAFERTVIAQFDQLLAHEKNRDYLVLLELFKLKLSQFPVDFRHLGTIFMINSSRSGRFTKEELRKFWDMCVHYQHNFPSHEFKMRIQGHGSVQLWEALQTEGGKAEVVEWYIQVLHENMKAELQTMRSTQKENQKDDEDADPGEPAEEDPGSARELAGEPDPGGDGMVQIVDSNPNKYLTMATVMLVHEMFQVQATQGINFQAFFGMLQQDGEERGLMSLNEEVYDELVPVDVLREFATQFFDGFIELMKEIQSGF